MIMLHFKCKLIVDKILDKWYYYIVKIRIKLSMEGQKKSFHILKRNELCKKNI